MDTMPKSRAPSFRDSPASLEPDCQGSKPSSVTHGCATSDKDFPHVPGFADLSNGREYGTNFHAGRGDAPSQWTGLLCTWELSDRCHCCNCPTESLTWAEARLGRRGEAGPQGQAGQWSSSGQFSLVTASEKLPSLLFLGIEKGHEIVHRIL